MKSEARMGVMTRGASLATVSGESGRMDPINWISRFRDKKPVWVLLGLFMLIVVVITQRQPLLALVDHPISQIKIQGKLNNLGTEKIEVKLADILGSSFLMADLLQIKASVESLPWVYRATVSRVWPGKISVHVVEQIPVAYWNGKSYLNAQGDIFTPAGLALTREIPRLNGPGESEQRVRSEILKTFKNLQGLLHPFNLSAAKLQMKPRGVWDLTLDNGILIALGGMPFESKIERLGAVLSNASVDAISRIKKVDTRYPNGVAVKWKEMVVASGNGLSQ